MKRKMPETELPKGLQPWMVQEAQSMGANAVIGVDLDYETVGQGSMLMVSASGTAVFVE